MTQIIPAILATTEQKYRDDVEKVNSIAALTDGWVHIDFMDNVFVPNLSIDLSIVAKYPINLKKEAHLMVQNPGNMLWDLIDLGFDRILLHAESDDIRDNLAFIEDHGFHAKGKVIETGLAINFETPLDKITPYINDIDVLLIMSIKPGFQGQPFIPEAISRIKEASQMGLIIEVDGAVSLDNVKLLMDAGVDNLMIGSRLLNGNVKQNLEKFKTALR